MPLTPFHMGPALVMKATARRHFSLRTFVITQIIIDLESARNVILHADALHGFLHSLIGATLPSLVVAVVGCPILNALNSPLRGFFHRVEGMPAWFAEEVVPITWAAAIVGGAAGGISHVLLDAIVHPDAEPFRPFSTSNPLFIDGSFYPVHYASALLGLLGFVAWLVVAKRRPRATWQSPQAWHRPAVRR